MLERIREGSQGIVAKSILGLVILTFAISGIGSYINSQADTVAATVNGVEIGQSELEQAYENVRRGEQSRYGQFFDQLASNESYLAGLRQQALEQLIVQELQKQQSNELGIRVSDEQVKEAIRNMPEFQQDGQFNNDIYVARLRQANYQPNQFRDYMRQQMARSQYVGALMSTEFALPTENEQYQALENQVRSFDVVNFVAADLETSVEVSDEELNDYYQLNLTRYMTEEKVSVEYLLLERDVIASDIVIADEELTDYYNSNLVEYSQPEQRRFAHILIESDEAKLEEVKAKLAAGEDFAEVAKQYSDDTLSAENGGDLEWLEQGVMDETFDAAAFALVNVGDVTEAVETEFGTHFIKLTEIQPEVVKSFDEVKDVIAETLKANRADEKYLTAQTTATEIAFEIADTLKDTADAVELQMVTTGLVSRYQLPEAINAPQVADKLFDEDFIADGMNSELIQIDENKSVFVRVSEHESARQQTLEEVTEQVKLAVVKKKARELAESKANELLAAVEAGSSLESASSQFNVSVERSDDVTRADNNVDPSVREAVFALAKPAEGSKEFAVVTLRNGNAALVALDNVSVKATEGSEVDSERLAGMYTQINGMALVEASKATADISK
jgi:peptidyl-prolyl cis-trans isomerase D